MVSRHRRWVLCSAASVVAGLASFGAGGAQAAVGGALPLTSTFRPDLRSVTLVSSNTAQFCFDKTLNASLVGGATSDPTMFSLGGYATTNFKGHEPFTSGQTVTQATSAVLDDTNPACVDVVFPLTANPEEGNNTTSTGKADLTQYTIGSVAAGAVTSNVRAESNDADSTALTGSTTHNGTTGNTTAPDLTGVTVNTSANTVNYVFNKNIGGAFLAAPDPANSIDPAGFFIVNSGGQLCRQVDPAMVSFSANVVTVVFPTGTTTDCPAFTAFPKPTAAAVRAGLDQEVVSSATADGFGNQDPQAAIVPGTSGTTALADLVSAVVSSDGNHVAYTFDKPIGTANADGFQIALANGEQESGTGTPTIANTATTGTVTVPFDQGSLFNEFDVKASVKSDTPPTVTVLNQPSVGNTVGSVPVGDNAGAFARGFTSGPDATAVTFNSTTGQAVISFDQRLDLTGSPVGILGGFVLLDQDGSPVAAAPATGITAVPSAAGPVQVTVDFPPAAFSVAKALELCGRPVNLFAAPAPAECTGGSGSGSVFSSWVHDPNVQQIISPFATSAALSRGYHGHWRHATRLSRRGFARRVAAAHRRQQLRQQLLHRRHHRQHRHHR